MFYDSFIMSDGRQPAYGIFYPSEITRQEGVSK